MKFLSGLTNFINVAANKMCNQVPCVTQSLNLIWPAPCRLSLPPSLPPFLPYLRLSLLSFPPALLFLSIPPSLLFVNRYLPSIFFSFTALLSFLSPFLSSSLPFFFNFSYFSPFSFLPSSLTLPSFLTYLRRQILTLLLPNKHQFLTLITYAKSQ